MSFFVFDNCTLTPFHSFIDEKSKYFDDCKQEWSPEKPKYKLLIGRLPGINEVAFFIEQTSKKERCKEGLYFCVESNDWEHKAEKPAHREHAYLAVTSYIDIRRVVPENIQDLFAKYSKRPADFAMVAKLPDSKKAAFARCFDNLPRHNLLQEEQQQIKNITRIVAEDNIIDTKITEFINKYY